MTQLRREIGVGALTAIGLGSIVGSGIFSLPASMAAVAGPSLLLAIILAGFITTCLALSYAELGAAFPMTGGPFAIPRLSMGELNGFVMGWGYFLYLFTGTAAILNIFVVYLGFVIPHLSHGMTLTPLGTAVAIALVWLFTLLNIRGVKWGALYSVITTICKFVPLVLFCLVGLWGFSTEVFTPFTPFGWSGVTAATTLCLWSYTGFEAMTVPGDEVKQPKRSIPFAIIVTMIITVLTYVAVSLSFLLLLNWQGLDLAKGDWAAIGHLKFPLANIAEHSSLGYLGWLALVTAIGAMISTGGAGGTWIMIQGRIPFAMAENGLFWPFLKKINQHGAPSTSLIVSSIGTSIILLLIPHFVSISLIASITALVPYSAAVLSVPILRKKKPNIVRHFSLPCHKTFTLISFIFSTWLIYWAGWPWTLIGTLLIAVGFLLFKWVCPHKKAEWDRNLWLIVYLLGVNLMSYLGDPHYELDNFTAIKPLGLFVIPYDMLILALWALGIYYWAYKVNIREHLGKETIHKDMRTSYSEK